MGGGRWSASDWATYSSAHVTSKRTVAEIYTSRSISNELNPKGVSMRESCDSVDNPNSTAIIVALDVTGSMNRVLEAMARTGLKTLAEEIYNRKPVSDPHIMFMGVGDVECDSAPLQITQFEADIRIAEQLTKLYLENGGGGNNYESYIFPWYFAAMHTRIDCFEKRRKKGYLFTVGDEEPTPYILSRHIQEFLGYDPQAERYTAEELLTMVSRNYDVFHLMVEEGSYFRRQGDRAAASWANLLGQRALRLADHTKMGEVIVSAIQVNEGMATKDAVDSWDGSTAVTVARAVENLGNELVTAGSSGLVKF